MQLPDLYMITGYFETRTSLFTKVMLALDSGVDLIQFRANWLCVNEYIRLAKELTCFVHDRGGTLMVKGDFALLSEAWCHGLSLRAHQLNVFDAPKKYYSKQLLSASCHNTQQIEWAKKIGVDFITISPVRHTSSHPNVCPLGLKQAEILTQLADMPVFWLGGMKCRDLNLVRQMGGQGIAAINEFWMP